MHWYEVKFVFNIETSNEEFMMSYEMVHTYMYNVG